MTIEDKLKSLETEYSQAIQQVNNWTVKKLKLEGAIEVFQSLLQEKEANDHKSSK